MHGARKKSALSHILAFFRKWRRGFAPNHVWLPKVVQREHTLIDGRKSNGPLLMQNGWGEYRLPTSEEEAEFVSKKAW
jgi:hypothetical protein